MAREPRRSSATGIHHVMNRGVDHQPVFFSDADRVEFGRQLARIHDELGVSILAYCLMGNHFHLLLRAPPDSLSVAMQRLISVYTRHTNDRVGRDGPLFRGRFHSIPVETDAYLLQASRYIHRNPLDLPGVDSPRDHGWSSYRAYLGLRRIPRFLDVETVTALFGGSTDAVSTFTEDGADVPGHDLRGIDDLRQLVACAIAVDDLFHPDEKTARQRLTRTVLILLADRTSDQGLRTALMAYLAHPSEEAVSRSVRRARHRHRSEPMVRRVVAWVEAELTPDRVGLTPSVRRTA